jgi:hypothetical protein
MMISALEYFLLITLDGMNRMSSWKLNDEDAPYLEVTEGEVVWRSRLFP